MEPTMVMTVVTLVTKATAEMFSSGRPHAIYL